MPMIGIGIGIENNTAVEYGQYACLTGFHFAVPQLQLAAPVLLPVFVQIYQHVHPALPVAMMWMNGKVGMDIQKAAAGGLMDTAAFEVLVLLEVPDPREGAQPF